MSRVIKSFRTEEDKEYILNPFTLISEKIKANQDTFVMEEKVSPEAEHHHHGKARDVLGEAQRQAKEIVENAQKQAAEITLKANEEAQNLKKEAEKTGREQGHKEGLNKGRQAFDGVIAQAEAQIQEMQAELQRFFDEAEDAVFAMSLAMTEQIINQKIASDNEIVVGIATRLLEKARNGRRFTLKCNPLDVPILTESMDVLSLANGGKEIELDDDRNIARGGCRLETDYGILDGTMESQLEQLRRIVEDAADEG